MRFSSFGIALAAMASIVSAAPQLAKRASTSDAASFGYATLGGGTTGGAGGTVTTISGSDANSLALLTAAVTGNNPKTVILTGTFSGNAVVQVGSNTSIIGKNSAATLLGVGLRVLNNENVIIRNVKIQKVIGDVGDAIGIQVAKRVWVDHCDLSSDRDHSKDYYDGLLDITHAVDYVTVSNTKFYNHYKGTLVGHSDNNGAEDRGHLTITYFQNYFDNINSRTPSFRFGTGHIYNNYFLNVGDGINTRVGARLLVENNIFEGTKKPLYSTDAGFATAIGNDWGGKTVTYLEASPAVTVPYSYSGGTATKTTIIAGAGNILSF